MDNQDNWAGLLLLAEFAYNCDGMARDHGWVKVCGKTYPRRKDQSRVRTCGGKEKLRAKNLHQAFALRFNTTTQQHHQQNIYRAQAWR